MSDSQPTASVPESAPPAPPGRVGVFFRRALRWATGVLSVFALGLVVLWAVQVQPLRQRVTALERDRQALQTSVAELESQVATLERVEAENESLQAAKASLELQMAVLQARIGTLKAQHVLASGGDAQEVVESLSVTDRQLERLESALAAELQEGVRSLRYRVAMVVGEISSHPFAAARDLEVLADGLESLEKDLGGE